MSGLSIAMKLDTLPDNLKQEAVDSIDFLVEKSHTPPKKRNTPQFGSAKGMFKMADDFDEPLDDLKEYM